VVWPGREDTWKTTILVIVFASLLGVFFWVLDLILTWLIRLLTGQPPA
jgi:preprotein translocase SecE subunit